MCGMVEKTAQVVLSSPETDVEGVREHIGQYTSVSEREAVFELFTRMLRGETVSDEMMAEYAGDFPDYLVDISVGDIERVERWLREAEADFQVARREDEEYMEGMLTMFRYFYRYEGCQEGVSFEEMVELQERTISKGQTLTVVVPV